MGWSASTVRAPAPEFFFQKALAPAHSIRYPRFHIQEHRRAVSLSCPVFSSISEGPVPAKRAQGSAIGSLFSPLTRWSPSFFPLSITAENRLTPYNFDVARASVLNHYSIVISVFMKRYTTHQRVSPSTCIIPTPLFAFRVQRNTLQWNTAPRPDSWLAFPIRVW